MINNCIIFFIFLFFKYSFLSNSFVYKFLHAIIFLFIESKAISCLSVELPKIYQYWSTVAYKRVAYKKKASVECLIKHIYSWRVNLLYYNIVVGFRRRVKCKRHCTVCNKISWRRRRAFSRNKIIAWHATIGSKNTWTYTVWAIKWPR